MPFVTTQDGTEIFYKDWGSGQPIVFHHGWPLSPRRPGRGDDVLRAARLSCGVAHDRRGHGRSTTDLGRP